MTFMAKALGGGGGAMRQQIAAQNAQVAEMRRQQEEQRRLVAEREAKTAKAESAQRMIRSGGRRGLLAFVDGLDTKLGGGG